MSDACVIVISPDSHDTRGVSISCEPVSMIRISSGGRADGDGGSMARSPRRGGVPAAPLRPSRYRNNPRQPIEKSASPPDRVRSGFNSTSVLDFDLDRSAQAPPAARFALDILGFQSAAMERPRTEVGSATERRPPAAVLAAEATRRLLLRLHGGIAAVAFRTSSFGALARKAPWRSIRESAMDRVRKCTRPASLTLGAMTLTGSWSYSWSH